MAIKTWLSDWFKSNRVILSNAGSLVGTMAVTSGLGFVYWWFAARQFSTTAVGVASAAISAMTLLGTIGMLGLGTLLIGELPRQAGKQLSLVSTALIAAGVTSTGLGVGFALLAPYLSADLQPLSASPGNLILFALGVGLTAVTLVLDQALIGLLRGSLQLWRNGLFATIKLVGLIVAGAFLAEKLGLTIYATWFIGNIISLLALAGFAAWKGVRLADLRPRWQVLRGLGKTAMGHHALNLALQVPSLVMPVLVTIMLSATTNAHFYLAWMIAGFVFVGPLALTTVLYAVGSADPAALAHKVRFTVKLAGLIGIAANLALLVGADLILGLFGQSYAEQAAWSLRILGVGVFAMIIKDHYVAIYRIYGQVSGAALRVAGLGLFELVAAAIGASLGDLVGLSLAWMVAIYLEAIVMVRVVFKAADPTHPQTVNLPTLAAATSTGSETN